MRSRGIGVGAALAVATCAIVVAGCGGDSGGPVTLNLLGPIDPGRTNAKAAKECSDQSDGRLRDQADAASPPAPMRRAS